MCLFVHSTQFGLHIDEGVKTTPADEADPREFLAVVEYARYKFAALPYKIPQNCI